MLKQTFIESFDICAFESAVELKTFTAQEKADFEAFLVEFGFNRDIISNIVSFVATEKPEEV